MFGIKEAALISVDYRDCACHSCYRYSYVFFSFEESSEKQFGDGCYLIVDNGAQLGYDLWDYPSPDEG